MKCNLMKMLLSSDDFGFIMVGVPIGRDDKKYIGEGKDANTAFANCMDKYYNDKDLSGNVKLSACDEGLYKHLEREETKKRIDKFIT